MDVDFLRFQVVRYAREGVEGAEIACADILHVRDVVIDNLEQPARFLRDVRHDVLQRFFVEGGGDARGVNRTHAVVGAAGFVAFDGDLHGQAAVEDDGDEGLDGHDVREGRESGVFAQRVPSETAVALHEAFGAHVFETGFFHEREGWLGELGCGEEAGGGAVGVGGCAVVDFFEDLFGFDGSVGTDGFEGHLHVVLTNGFSARTTEVDCELFGIVLHDVGDCEA